MHKGMSCNLCILTIDRCGKLCYTIDTVKERGIQTMKKNTWYGYTFADGYYCECRGMSANERKVEERKHGKLVSKRAVAV